MYKLYPKSREIGQQFVQSLMAGDCSFVLSCSDGKMEIRGWWSAAIVCSLVEGAGLNLDRDFDLE